MKRIASPPAVSPPWSRPQLEVRDLELVLSLAASGTTAAAASTLHLTQSAVSRALGQAEERVGARLFSRSARGVVPTAAGERLIAGARLVLGQLRELEQQIAAPATPPTRVRMVCECYTAYRWLPSAMAQLRRRQPHLEVDVAVEHTHAPVDALVRGDIEVALLTTGTLPSTQAARGTLVERPLFSDEIVFVMSTSHPLAGRRAITPDDLRHHALVTSDAPPCEARWFLKAVFGRQTPKLHFVHFPLTEAVMDAARAGMGIAVVSEWIAEAYLGSGDLVLKRLSSGPLRRPWRIAYRRELGDAVDRLVGAIETSRPVLSAR